METKVVYLGTRIVMIIKMDYDLTWLNHKDHNDQHSVGTQIVMIVKIDYELIRVNHKNHNHLRSFFPHCL
jgi:hypothetical protein